MRVIYFVAVVLICGCRSHPFVHPLSELAVDKTSILFDDKINIQADPTVPNTSGSWVTVSWNGVDSPNAGDWIGVYEPAQANYSATAPVKYQYATASPSHMVNGTGSLRFRLVNMRVDIGFVFFRNGTENPVVAAVSNAIMFANPNEPTQIHLAVTKCPSMMSVSWVSGNVSLPQVKWGSKSMQYTSTSKASFSSYGVKDLCGAPATTVGWREPGYLIQANMTGLESGVRYYYVVGDEKYGWSSEASFVAPPKPSRSRKTQVVAYGDMGNGQVDGSYQHWEQQPSLQTTSNIFNTQMNITDFILHIGDISYAVGYAAEWDEFFDQIQPIASHIPYMVCIGNHERDFPGSRSLFYGQDSGGECGVPYEKRFSMPRPSLDEPWYGIIYGSIHFVLMSTEHEWGMGSTQYDFLVRELASVNRTETPWLVIAGHRPMYIDSTDNTVPAGENHVALLLQHDIEPLLQEHSVDLGLWGHHHSYQRTCPVYQKKCTANGTTHVVIGMGGQTVENDRRDTAGQERFRSIQIAHFRGAMGIMLVYDVTSEESFKNVSKWRRRIETDAHPGVVWMLLGNKCEMDDKRKVSKERGEQIAEKFAVSFLEISAKKNLNIEEAFMTLAEDILKKNPKILENEPQTVRVAYRDRPNTGSRCCSSSATS